jgi:hypothetical protein
VTDIRERAGATSRGGNYDTAAEPSEWFVFRHRHPRAGLRVGDATGQCTAGAAMRVHNRLGPGLKDEPYQRALTAEMLAAGLAVSAEHM